ncbi:MAG: tRNA 2-thiouridine(34) synthase MnmA [Bacteroidales bacterium]
MKQRVLLAMSGGIDSTVSALLLQQQGFDVTGITFGFDENSIGGFTETDEIARKLRITLHKADLGAVFQKEVVDYFVDEYLAGKTPFPCLVCNNKIKWPYLAHYSEIFNCKYIATGHYARKWQVGGNVFVRCAADAEKDQSFFLWALPVHILEKTIFPLGNIEKKEVRKIAAESGFSCLNLKKESTGPCFIKGKDYRPFLRKKIAERGIIISDGDFIAPSQKIIGRHNGYPFYTIGQRRGLKLRADDAMYVKEINPSKNQVVISDKKSLYVNAFTVINYYLSEPAGIETISGLKVRIRYRKQETPCRLNVIDEQTLIVNLSEPLDSVSPGQSAVFYSGDLVAGGGFIQ